MRSPDPDGRVAPGVVAGEPATISVDSTGRRPGVGHHRRAGCGAPSACDRPPGSGSGRAWPSASRGGSRHVPPSARRAVLQQHDAFGRRHQRRAVGHRDDGSARRGHEVGGRGQAQGALQILLGCVRIGPV